jgi:DcuC family C4-dicarboxylate transporter
LCVHRRDVSGLTKAFFEGMGYAYIHVISLIIAAGCFIAGMESARLLAILVGSLHGGGVTAKVLTLLCPWLLGVVSGSGTAPSVGFSKAVLPTLSASDVNGALNLGVLAAIGATFGRTMSPVAAVVIYTSTLTSVAPMQIVKKVAPTLAIGGIVVLLVMMTR